MEFKLLFNIFCVMVGIDAAVKQEKLLQLDQFLGYCEGQEHLPMGFQNLTMYNVERIIHLSATLLVRHDLNNSIEQTLDIKRCRNKDAPDTCEMYQNLKFSRCCELLKSKGQFWTPFVNKIHPRVICPVKAGTYIVDDATFDPSLTLFAVNGWYWKVRVNSYDIKTKEHLMCLYTEGQVVTKSSKTEMKGRHRK